MWLWWLWGITGSFYPSPQLIYSGPGKRRKKKPTKTNTRKHTWNLYTKIFCRHPCSRRSGRCKIFRSYWSVGTQWASQLPSRLSQRLSGGRLTTSLHVCWARCHGDTIEPRVTYLNLLPPEVFINRGTNMKVVTSFTYSSKCKKMPEVYYLVWLHLSLSLCPAGTESVCSMWTYTLYLQWW